MILIEVFLRIRYKLQIFSRIIDFLVAKHCPFCGEFNSDGHICVNCYSKLEFLSLACLKCQQPMNVYSENINVCPKCSLIDEFYNEMRCVLSYNVFLKKIILRLKNRDEIYLADILIKLLYIRSKDLVLPNAVIVPVPLFPSRIRKRGYNQSSFLAKKYAELANIEYIDDLLLRVKDTKTQAGKSAKERVSNVHDAFILNEKYNIHGKVVFIIDDIITTGATIFECARALKIVLPGSIYLLALGRRVI